MSYFDSKDLLSTNNTSFFRIINLFLKFTFSIADGPQPHHKPTTTTTTTIIPHAYHHHQTGRFVLRAVQPHLTNMSLGSAAANSLWGAFVALLDHKVGDWGSEDHGDVDLHVYIVRFPNLADESASLMWLMWGVIVTLPTKMLKILSLNKLMILKTKDADDSSPINWLIRYMPPGSTRPETQVENLITESVHRWFAQFYLFIYTGCLKKWV